MTSPPQAPVKVPTRRVVMGQITEVEESYAREVAIPPIVLFPVVVAAFAVDVVALLLSTVLRIRIPSARRPLKALRKGPEYMVTPIWVRDADDSLVELEVHGHLNRSARPVQLRATGQRRVRQRRLDSDEAQGGRLPDFGQSRRQDSRCVAHRSTGG